MRNIIIATIIASAAAVAPANAATFIVSTGNLDSFETVHFDGTSGTSISAHVKLSGDQKSTVLFSSTNSMTVSGGQGQATLNGPLSNLDVQFGDAWSGISFNLDGASNGVFSLKVNGVDVVCTICDVARNGQNRFNITGDEGITSLSFNFTPAIADVKQFRVGVMQSPVPEPATWAMMIAGLGLVGGMMRRRVTTLQFS